MDDSTKQADLFQLDEASERIWKESGYGEMNGKNTRFRLDRGESKLTFAGDVFEPISPGSYAQRTEIPPHGER